MLVREYIKSNETVFITILLAMSAVTSIASDMYIAAFPEMVGFFGISADSASLTVSIFFIAVAISQLIYGPLSDYLGRKKIILFGLVVFSTGCIICAMSSWFWLFLLGRFIQGCGAGATTCISRAIIRDTYEGPALSKVLSYVGMGMAIVPAIAPILGAYLQSMIGWKVEFLFMLLYALFLMTAVSRVIDETNSYARQHKKGIKVIIFDYLKALSDPQFYINMFVASQILAMIYVFYSFTSFYLQETYNWSEVEYSKISIVIAASLFIGRKINIILTRRLPNDQVTLLGCIVSILSAMTMCLFYVLNLNVALILLPPIALYSISGGIIFSNTFVGATNKFTKTIGTVSSLYGFMQMFTVFIIITATTIIGISSVKDIFCCLFTLSMISTLLIIKLIRNPA